MALEEILSVYLQRECLRPLFYGENDCCLFPANFTQELTGHDPAEPFRGKYSTEEGALKFCVEAGGLPILINRAFQNCGFKSIEYPENGDCGCVNHEGESVGAIFSDGRWCVKTPLGVAFIPEDEVRVLKIWNVSEGFR